MNRIYDYLENTAISDPDREAICFKKTRISYNELSNWSNQLANALVECGTIVGDRIGILAPKSIESVVAMYGIMKSGGAYVPIDPSASADRQAKMISDCGISCVVTLNSQRNRLNDLVHQGVKITHIIGFSSANTDSKCKYLDWDFIRNHFALHLPNLPINAHDLAYIIYTSGSTGRPKGIMHTHRSSLSFAKWAANEYNLTASDRLANHAPLHFDLSIFDYFAAIVAGSTTVIIPEAYTRLPASYSELLQSEKVTVLFTVPFALIQLLEKGVLNERNLDHLRLTIYGGEPFPPKHLRALMKILSNTIFDNMYGPAEINGCTHYTLPTKSLIGDDPIPIGKLNQNCKGLVMDESGEILPCGTIGELLVNTPTMMKGYWGQPELTKRALYNPEREDLEKLIYYRTGDLVRMQDDGTLHFLGRKDRQVKTRGYRVELDEVEGALNSHLGIEEAAAYQIKDPSSGDNRIEAAITLKPGKTITTEELQVHAKSKLPPYAVPSRIIIRSSFPRTTTGKIDRLSLELEANSGNVAQN